VGAHEGHRAHGLSGDGRYHFVANGRDNTVTQIDVTRVDDAATRGVVRTIQVDAAPTTFASFGTAEGPSHQTGPFDDPPHPQ
jgi:hypothetical protein